MAIRTEQLEANEEGIQRAAALLREGKLVAFPTETVYGLGADATSDEAVRGIFSAKGRPSSNPLIVHVSGSQAARAWTSDWSDRADLLARVFWPGPLTLVLPASPGIARSTLAGGKTVGLRAPRHPVALALLNACGLPLAAPSANLSNSISPTTAADVLVGLAGRIDAVLNGGICEVGIESTVLDLTMESPTVLRPGMITPSEIADVLGVRVGHASPVDGNPAEVLRSPGQFPRHYAPRIPLVLSQTALGTSPSDFVITCGDFARQSAREMTLPRDPLKFAARIYGALRCAEASGADRIILRLPDLAEQRDERWQAILDRLRRAASVDT